MNETCEKSFDYVEQLKHAGKLWYIISPFQTSFEFLQDVPDYYFQVWLSFFVLITLEHMVLFARNENSFRFNDQVTSLSHWVLQESVRIVSRGAEHWTYIAVYDKYRLWSLAWDDPWTWYVALVGVDFCYYWVHRANHGYSLFIIIVLLNLIPFCMPRWSGYIHNHLYPEVIFIQVSIFVPEIHFLWAQHQVHHSSEEFTLVVGLRQSVFQHWFSFMFYLPLALFLPPSHFVAHHQFNLIYQLWIHTTVVKDLGILEFILNTPKHHRVHHGCNLYCLDKNYGGVLILWDRIFGTFVEEKSEEKIIFGLVSSPRSFNPLYLQTFYTRALIEKCRAMKGFGDKLAVIWKGPSWFPGAPRLGLDEFKINVTSRSIYDIQIPAWKNLYILLQLCIVFFTHWQLCTEERNMSLAASGVVITNNVFALTVIGMLFDNSKYAAVVELARCVLFLNVTRIGYDGYTYTLPDMILSYAHIASCCLWVVYILREFKSSLIS